MLSNYPVERPVLVAVVLNAIDLARVIVLLKIDIAALMGYTGAVFERFFGSGREPLISSGALLVWVALPAWLAMRRVTARDL
jgi:Cu-processing system permease protein